ncbi:MAG: hypothetical protein IJ686_00365 [Bacteroidales bacterium]|nr:hypothetical protein [Bacteroidales bacterium]
MKKFLYAVMAMAFSVTFIGCDKEDSDKDDKDDEMTETVFYQGTLTAQRMQPADSPGNPYTLQDVKVGLAISREGDDANVVIYDMKFSEGMPLLPETLIPDLDYRAGRLSGDDIDPIIGEVAYPSYKVTDFDGSVGDGIIAFELYFGSYYTQFAGVEIAE